MSEDKRKKFADLNIHGIESGSEFEHSRINVDEDEDTQRDLAKMAEIEERNAKMERIRLDKEKVVGSEVKKTVRDGVQIRTYRVAPGADTVYNVRTESEIDREIAEYRKKKEKEQEDLFDLNIDSRSVSAEEAQSQIRIDPEQVAEYLKKIVKDDRIVCIGDSITYGFEVEGTLTWIGRLRREEEINLLNVGINGDTCGNMLGRFKEHVIDLAPKAVFIMGGGNDILAGTPLEYVTNSVAMMAQMALNKGIVPIIGIAPEPSPKDVPKEWHQLMDSGKGADGYLQRMAYHFCESKSPAVHRFRYRDEDKAAYRLWKIFYGRRPSESGGPQDYGFHRKAGISGYGNSAEAGGG